MPKVKSDLSVVEVAKILSKSPQFIRMGLQQQRLAFGTAVQNQNGNWSYVIYPKKFCECIGITEEELKRRKESMNDVE